MEERLLPGDEVSWEEAYRHMAALCWWRRMGADWANYLKEYQSSTNIVRLGQMMSAAVRVVGLDCVPSGQGGNRFTVVAKAMPWNEWMPQWTRLQLRLSGEVCDVSLFCRSPQHPHPHVRFLPPEFTVTPLCFSVAVRDPEKVFVAVVSALMKERLVPLEPYANVFVYDREPK